MIHRPYRPISSAALPIAIVLVLALLALRFARPLVRRVLGHLLERQLAEGEERAVALPEVQKRVDTLESVVVSATRLAVAALAALLLLVIFDLAPVVAGLGLAIAAFAFAGQEIVKDYLMGFLIILENQYYKGDVVTIGGVTGTVEDIALTIHPHPTLPEAIMEAAEVAAGRPIHQMRGP